MNKTIRKITALLLVAMTVLALIPFTAAAADEKSATLITSADQLVTGEYVIVTKATNKAMTTFDSGSSWVLATDGTAVDGKIDSVAANTIWTVTVDGTSVTLKDSAGNFIKPKTGNNNGILSGTYNWEVTFTNGVFTFAGTGSDTTKLASNKNESGKFRSYKTTTINGNKAGYPCEFYLYAVGTAAADDTTAAAPDTTVATPDTTVAAPEVPTTPINPNTFDTSKKYTMHLVQANLGKTLYFNGAMSGNYFATTEDANAAALLTVETVEGGYLLSFMDGATKKYIDIYEYQTGKAGVRITETPTGVFKYSDAAGTWVVNCAGSDRYLGTYNTFATFSASAISYITGENAANVGVSQFPAIFTAVEAEETTAEETTVEETTAEETTVEATTESTTAAAPETTVADTTVTDPGATGDTAVLFVILAVVAVLSVAIVAKKRTN